jgi:hypothetical protein
MDLKEIGYEDMWIGISWLKIGSGGRLLCVELVVCGYEAFV